MNNLNKLSKADLIWVVQRMITAMGADGEIRLSRAMLELDYQKEQDLVKRAEDAAGRAAMARKRIVEILTPYDVMPFIDIPIDALELAAAAKQEAADADKEWEKIMCVGRRKR